MQVNVNEIGLLLNGNDINLQILLVVVVAKYLFTEIFHFLEIKCNKKLLFNLLLQSCTQIVFVFVLLRLY